MGGIYGEDGNGNWIVGYGVSGSANIVVTPDHVEFGSARSEPFSPETKVALAEQGCGRLTGEAECSTIVLPCGRDNLVKEAILWLCLMVGVF